MEFRLRGSSSNLNGVGAKLTAWSNGSPQAQAIIAGQGYLGTGSDLTAHFGLGSNSFLDSLIVRWPSGTIDKYYHLAANQKLSLYEGNAPPTDRSAPQISNVAANNLTETTATINWETNESADSQVEYGLNTNYGSFSTLDGNLVTSHAIALSNLTANTTYHFRVRSKDAAGNLAISNDFTFTTARDTQAPVMSNIAASSITMTSAQISWNSDEPADSQVEYGLNTNYGSLSTIDGNFVTSHAMPLLDLTANTIYHYRVRSKDAAGNLAISNDFTFTTARDTEAPAISNIVITAITANSAQIKWNTNELSDSRVEYGADSTMFAASVVDTNFVTTHVASLLNLKSHTIYYFRITAKDNAGNATISAIQNFTTLSTGIDESNSRLPATLTLRNYPNPFYDFTRFEVNLPASGLISLKIFDLQGREIATLAEESRRAGQHFFTWQIKTAASGIYFAVLRYQDSLETASKSFAPAIVMKQKLFYLK
jgi:type VI protein secretion system component Hcp